MSVSQDGVRFRIGLSMAGETAVFSASSSLAPAKTERWLKYDLAGGIAILFTDQIPQAVAELFGADLSVSGKFDGLGRMVEYMPCNGNFLSCICKCCVVFHVCILLVISIMSDVWEVEWIQKKSALSSRLAEGQERRVPLLRDGEDLEKEC